MITQEYLKSILNYDPETGVFTWKVRNDVPSNWNTKYANKIAGSDHGEGYIKITINSKNYKAHRLAFLYVYGWLPYQVDHIDGCGSKSNNNILNLRSASHSENKCNQRKYISNKSGLKGVWWNKRIGKWQSSIQVDNKRKHLGSFDCPAAAFFAYQIAANVYHGEFGRFF